MLACKGTKATGTYLGALTAPEAVGKSEDCREFAAGSDVETELRPEIKAALGKWPWSLQTEL